MSTYKINNSFLKSHTTNGSGSIARLLGPGGKVQAGEGQQLELFFTLNEWVPIETINLYQEGILQRVSTSWFDYWSQEWVSGKEILTGEKKTVQELFSITNSFKVKCFVKDKSLISHLTKIEIIGRDLVLGRGSSLSWASANMSQDVSQMEFLQWCWVNPHTGKVHPNPLKGWVKVGKWWSGRESFYKIVF